jgi:fructokinase
MNARQYEVICFGEVLWDILPEKKVPGGAPMNVAYHLEKLGHPTAIFSAIGNDEAGNELLKVLDNIGLDANYVQRNTEYETGKVYANISDNQDVSYDIVKPVAWDYIKEDDQQADLLSDAAISYIVFGSLACRNTVSMHTLANILNFPAVKVLDINLRPPHYTREVLEWLMRSADIMKLNEAELILVTDWFSQATDLEGRIRALSTQYKIPEIVVTLGAAGAILYVNDTFYRHAGFKVTVADTIGSGDSFLAAYLHGRSKQQSPQEIITFAAAMGACIATYSGGCPDYQLTAVEQLMKGG